MSNQEKRNKIWAISVTKTKNLSAVEWGCDSSNRKPLPLGWKGEGTVTRVQGRVILHPVRTGAMEGLCIRNLEWRWCGICHMSPEVERGETLASPFLLPSILPTVPHIGQIQAKARCHRTLGNRILQETVPERYRDTEQSKNRPRNRTEDKRPRATLYL